MRLKQLPLVTCGNSSRKQEVLVSVVLCSSMVFCAIHIVGMRLGWLSLKMQVYKQACSSGSFMSLVVGILACIIWLAPYPNDIDEKDCMLILNSTANSALFARE